MTSYQANMLTGLRCSTSKECTCHVTNHVTIIDLHDKIKFITKIRATEVICTAIDNNELDELGKYHIYYKVTYPILYKLGLYSLFSIIDHGLYLFLSLYINPNT